MTKDLSAAALAILQNAMSPFPYFFQHVDDAYTGTSISSRIPVYLVVHMVRASEPPARSHVEKY
jgi:hypothetical protein